MDQILLPYESFPHLLSILIFLPLAGIIPLLFINSDSFSRNWTLIVTSVVALLSIQLLFGFDAASTQFQFREHYVWVESLNINYTVGMDGISILLFLLTTFIMPFCVLASWNYIKKRVKTFMICLLIMETSMLGVFVALDFVLFYILWEAMLIPMYLLIGIWGGPRKIYASIKFFLYTLAGSVLMLVAIIWLYQQNNYSFFIPEMMWKDYAFLPQILIFIAFFLLLRLKCQCSHSTHGYQPLMLRHLLQALSFLQVCC